MKYLFVIAHCDPKKESTTYSLSKFVKNELEQAGHEVKVVDLIEDGFKECPSKDDFINIGDKPFFYPFLQKNDNLIPLIKEHQQKLLWAENIIVFAPIWFLGLPAVFYSYIQRVFTYGWGYTLGGKRDGMPLFGRRIMFVVGTGAPKPHYLPNESATTIEGILYHVTNTMYYSGLDCKYSFPVFTAPSLKGDDRIKKFAQVSEAVNNIEKRKSLPFEEKHTGNTEVATFSNLQYID
ncbi:Flavodoxin-like fold family protein [Trichomonas vaginalis G3]|uniref:Flavodoxin-like fold family protein n=1 Tax=Trichomonas vaginalis (strain ATCC PRA-98 / G3) TaxID=412133 RepID=A2FCL6_TRIV3|nr:NAD(P)H oxidoreductase-related family [Trichomonas vaginalis G3]EAX97338.1 Flavodoxin-like fold family protein [Trichomonas vaginalis G3]KAI5533126.1 NAD(P)H oxidoreductase-related family [Trichomonas vaginalis G3]|eukprot:XP_001310268.1 Flavodoxin-like fold family protein [Trichomonas vaginalis G3]